MILHLLLSSMTVSLGAVIDLAQDDQTTTRVPVTHHPTASTAVTLKVTHTANAAALPTFSVQGSRSRKLSSTMLPLAPGIKRAVTPSVLSSTLGNPPDIVIGAVVPTESGQIGINPVD